MTEEKRWKRVLENWFTFWQLTITTDVFVERVESRDHHPHKYIRKCSCDYVMRTDLPNRFGNLNIENVTYRSSERKFVLDFFKIHRMLSLTGFCKKWDQTIRWIGSWNYQHPLLLQPDFEHGEPQSVTFHFSQLCVLFLQIVTILKI